MKQLDAIICCYGCSPAVRSALSDAVALLPGHCTLKITDTLPSSATSGSEPHSLVLLYLDSPFAIGAYAQYDSPHVYVCDENYFGDRAFINIHWPIEAIAVVLMQSLANSTSANEPMPAETLQRAGETQEAQLFRALMSASPDLIFIISEDGDFIETLAADETLLIDASAKLRGHSVYDILPEHYVEEVRTAIERSLASATMVDFEYELELPIGKKYFHAKISDMHLILNGKRTVVCMSRDCTYLNRRIADLKNQNLHLSNELAHNSAAYGSLQAHENMAESAQRFDEISEMMPQAIIEIDISGKIIFANTYSSVLTGYSEAELIRMEVAQFLDTKDLSALASRLRDQIRGTIANTIYKIRRKDGSNTLVQSISAPFYRSGLYIGRRAIFINIEEQKRREDILKDQALFMRFNPAPNFKIDAQGKIVSCNPAAVKLFNADYAGKPVSQLFPGVHLSLENEKFSFTVTLGGHTYSFYAVRGLYSNYMYFYGADISDILAAQSHNQELLKLQKERLKKLNCLYLISKEIQNPRNEEDVIMQVLQKIPDSYQYPHIACMRIVYKNIDVRTDNFAETEWKQQSRIYAGKKEIGLLDVRYLSNPGICHEGPFMQEERQLISAAGYLLGALSRRLEAEDENRMLRKAVEQNPASIMICNAQHQIEYVNQAYISSIGYSEDELIQRNAAEFQSHEHRAEFYNQMWETVGNGSIWHGDICNRSKSGELYWERGSVSPIYDDRGLLTHFVEIKENITARKQMEEDLRKAMIDAEAANHAKSEFLANVSHEIRTPLNSIVGFSDLLQSELHDRKLISYLESIKNSGQNLLSLINDILDLAKIEAGKLDVNILSVNVRQLFDELGSMFSLRIHQKQLSFFIDIPNDFPQLIRFDELRLKQILINLLSNAIKFTASGEIRLQLVFQLQDTGNALDMEISVADTGEGIDDDQLEKIFLSFNQGKDSYKRQLVGTGLGLTISRRLAELMGGMLSVVSQKGLGSVFSLIFKDVAVAENKSGAEPKKEEAGHGIDVRFCGQRVLVVDDQPAERNYVMMGLIRTGLSVEQASSSEEGLETAYREQPDLVITDIVMPAMNGFEFAEKLHAKYPKLPVIAMSASIMKYSQRLYSSPHFTGILVKPFKLEELYSCIMNILEYEQVRTSSGTVPTPNITVVNPVLAEMLQGPLFQKWKSFEQQQPLDEVQAFAETLVSAGTEFEYPELIEYGQALLKCLEIFDIEIMLSKLREFPSMIHPNSD